MAPPAAWPPALRRRGWLLSLLLASLSGCDCGVPKLQSVFDAGCVAETCDGYDQDCNGLVDDGLPELSCGVGACTRTLYSCLDGVEQACEPGLPAEERCNGLDDDCDGETDEGLAPLSCGRDACAITVPACEDGVPTTCTAREPAAETCNGLDDDCDGLVDDDLAPLSCGVGGCARTVPACTGGVAQTCAPGQPATDICNGVDDDCDGETDEGFAPLQCGVGACARSVTACLDGVSQPCVPGTPSAERCNGLDDDCDGSTDEDLPVLSCGVGQCARTVPACVSAMVQACVEGTPGAETCNGLDDDCDGASDEDLPPLSCGRGVCARSVPACAGGVPQACTPGPSSAEVCDGLDNDCDGATDEDGICSPPVVVCGGSLSATVGSAVTLTATATDSDGTIAWQQWQVTGRPAGSTAQPASPAQESTSFTPDLPGTYSFTFCARDNAGSTACCFMGLSTSTCASPPSPPVSTACGTSWDGRPIVQFPTVPAGLVYQLALPGDAMVRAEATEGQNYLRPAGRLVAGGPMPGAPTSLEVRACRANDLSCCSTPSTLSVNVVESCTTPVPPTSANLVLSEYVVNGEGSCTVPATCQAGEAVELTNLSNCPINLEGAHFAYRNPSATASSYRWMNFPAGELIPPRGVYVAMRGQQSAPTCSASFSLATQSAGLYGLRISTLAMQGSNLDSGWFNNGGGGLSSLQVAPGIVPSTGVTSFASPIAEVAPYVGNTSACVGVGFNALNSCGDFPGATTPSTVLMPNQLGRLWHPCDSVTSPAPACVRD